MKKVHKSYDGSLKASWFCKTEDENKNYGKNCIYTSWGSMYNMLKRHSELKEFLLFLEIENVVEVPPIGSENREIDDLYELLKDMESVSLVLKKEVTWMQDDRILFDGKVEAFPELHGRLAEDAYIMLCN